MTNIFFLELLPRLQEVWAFEFHQPENKKVRLAGMHNPPDRKGADIRGIFDF